MLPKRILQLEPILQAIWRHWIRAWWPWHWRTARMTLVWRYEECRCGYRRYTRVGRGYQPIDQRWMLGADWSPAGTLGNTKDQRSGRR